MRVHRKPSWVSRGKIESPLFVLPLAVLLLSLSTTSLGGRELAAPLLQFPTYASYQAEVLSLISRAERSVWLASQDMRDGDVASALYMAQYRQVQVYALLSQDQLSATSQFPQLKLYKIPLAWTRAHFFKDAPAWLQVDGRLYLLEGGLEGRQKEGRHFLREASQPALDPFVARFRAAFERGSAAPVPLSTASTPATPPPRTEVQQDSSHGFSGYRFKGGSAKPPHDVARRLPKAPKWQGEAK